MNDGLKVLLYIFFFSLLIFGKLYFIGLAEKKHIENKVHIGDCVSVYSRGGMYATVIDKTDDYIIINYSLKDPFLLGGINKVNSSGCED